MADNFLYYGDNLDVLRRHVGVLLSPVCGRTVGMFLARRRHSIMAICC